MQYEVGTVPIPEDVELKKIANIGVTFPDFPTRLNFLFVRHDSSENLPNNLEQGVDAHDVILLEGACWKEESLVQGQAISDGNATELQKYTTSARARGDTFGIGLMQAIYGSGKQIRYCDLPDTRKNRATIQQSTVPIDLSSTPNFDVLVNNLKNQSVQLSKHVIFERDKYMIRNVYPAISSAVGDKNIERRVKGLFIVGGAHQAVAYTIKKQIAKHGVKDKHVIRENYFEVTPDTTQLLYHNFLAGKPVEEHDVLLSMLERLINLPTRRTFECLMELTPERARFMTRFLLIGAGHTWAMEAGDENPERVARAESLIDEFLNRVQE